METVLAEKAYEALQVCHTLLQLTNLLHTLGARRCAAPNEYLTPITCFQAEQQSTEFRIKALGKALEYKHLEVLPSCNPVACCYRLFW